jgi:hypothetical protein
MNSASSLAVSCTLLPSSRNNDAEAPALEAFLKDAKACPVPHEHFAAGAPLVDEQEQLAR